MTGSEGGSVLSWTLVARTGFSRLFIVLGKIRRCVIAC